MPRTKKKPEQPAATPQPAATNGPLSDVLTLAEAAAYLRLSEAEVLRSIHEQALPARQVGTEWRLLKTTIQQWLSNDKPPVNEQGSLAGIWENDPYIETNGNRSSDHGATLRPRTNHEFVMRQRRQGRAQDWALCRLMTIGEACRAMLRETLRGTLSWAIDQVAAKSQKPEHVFMILGLG